MWLYHPWVSIFLERAGIPLAICNFSNVRKIVSISMLLGFYPLLRTLLPKPCQTKSVDWWIWLPKGRQILNQTTLTKILGKEIGGLVSEEWNSYRKHWGQSIGKDVMISLSTELKLASGLKHLNGSCGFLHFSGWQMIKYSAELIYKFLRRNVVV